MQDEEPLDILEFLRSRRKATEEPQIGDRGCREELVKKTPQTVANVEIGDPFRPDELFQKAQHNSVGMYIPEISPTPRISTDTIPKLKNRYAKSTRSIQMDWS